MRSHSSEIGWRMEWVSRKRVNGGRRKRGEISFVLTSLYDEGGASVALVKATDTNASIFILSQETKSRLHLDVRLVTSYPRVYRCAHITHLACPNSAEISLHAFTRSHIRAGVKGRLAISA